MAKAKKKASKPTYKTRRYKKAKEFEEQPVPNEIPAAAENDHSTFSMLPVMRTEVFKLKVRETARGIMYELMNAPKLQIEFMNAGAADSGVPRAKYLAENAFAMAEEFEDAFDRFASPF